MAPKEAKDKAKPKAIRTRSSQDERVEPVPQEETEISRLLRQAEWEEATGGYETDTSEYIAPDPTELENEEDDILAQAWKNTDRATWFFDEPAHDTMLWYQSVLEKTLWLPDKLQRLFLYKEADLNFNVSARKMKDLNTKLERSLQRDTFLMSRKCVIAFFGDPYIGCRLWTPLHYEALNSFLDERLKTFEREQVLYVLLVNIYWRQCTRQGQRLTFHSYTMNGKPTWKH